MIELSAVILVKIFICEWLSMWVSSLLFIWEVCSWQYCTWGRGNL